jgi:hypothetical protein
MARLAQAVGLAGAGLLLACGGALAGGDEYDAA